MLREIEDIYFWRNGELSDDEIDRDQLESAVIEQMLSEKKLAFSFKGKDIALHFKDDGIVSRVSMVVTGTVVINTLLNASASSTHCRHLVAKYVPEADLRTFDLGISKGRDLLHREKLHIQNLKKPHGAVEAEYILAPWKEPVQAPNPFGNLGAMFERQKLLDQSEGVIFDPSAAAPGETGSQ